MFVSLIPTSQHNLTSMRLGEKGIGGGEGMKEERLERMEEGRGGNGGGDDLFMTLLLLP